MSIKVIQPGLLSSIQDFGRTGYAQYGVPQSGVMDRYAVSLMLLSTCLIPITIVL